jgi:hypothetical protein
MSRPAKPTLALVVAAVLLAGSGAAAAETSAPLPEWLCGYWVMERGERAIRFVYARRPFPAGPGAKR